MAGVTVGGGGTPEKAPAVRSCKEALNDAEFLVSSKNLAKQGVAPGILLITTYPSKNKGAG